MRVELIEALVEKKAFSDDTIITAHYNTIDTFGRQFTKTTEFKIGNIIDNSNESVFELVALQDNRVVRSSGSEITAIDGMDLSRYADIYNLHPDGSIKKIGKKRGRKPRIRIENIN